MKMTKSLYQNFKEHFPAPIAIVRKLMLGDGKKVQTDIQGKGNVFSAGEAVLSNIRIDIIGDNNKIEIGRGCVLSNIQFRIRGSNHRIEFGERCRISRGAVIWFEDSEGVLQVGPGTTMVEVHIAVTENSKVVIGKDCMFANDIDIRTGDSHSVVDARSG
jgi:hypothetical protein